MGWADAPEVEAAPAWSSAPLIEPDMAKGNQSFSRVVGDALSKTATTLKPAVDTIADVGSVYAPIETALNAGTGLLFGFPAQLVTGLGGLAAKHALGMNVDPAEMAENMRKVFTYGPVTQRGQRLTGNVNDFLGMYGAPSGAGHAVTDIASKLGTSTNVAAAVGAVTEQTVGLLPFILTGELARKMGGQTIGREDMANVAKAIGGDEPVHVAAAEDSLHSVYDKTGIGPYTILDAANNDPALRADLIDPKVDVPKALEAFVEKPKEADMPTPGDGAPLLDVSGSMAHETASGIEYEPPAKASEHMIGSLETREVPIKDITLSDDVPQFKSDANANGVVDPLGGKFDRTGVAPIQLWKRTNGATEVISGRHRLDLAQRSGENTIPAQTHYEDQGFDVRRASALDAELNIRDGQGKVKDYVDYFRSSQIDQSTAEQRGLLARSIGKRAFTIASHGSDELIASHRAGHISDEAAVAISSAAPGDGRLQSVGIRAIESGKTIGQAANTVRAVKLLAGDKPVATGDLFGFDDSAMREAESMAKIATGAQREIQSRISAISGAAKRPELAAAEGIDVKDSAAVLRRLDELRTEKSAWDSWSTNPDLIEEIRAQLHPDGEPLLKTQTVEDLTEKTARESNAAALDQKAQIDREAEHFTLQGETQEKFDTTGSLFDTGTVELNAGLNPMQSLRDIRDSYTPFVGVESPNAVVKRIEASPRQGMLDALQKVFAPASRGDIAAQQAGIMRANFGEMARSREMALEGLKTYAAKFDKMPVEDNVKFIDAYEHGTKLDDPQLNAAAEALHALNKEKREQIQALGKGQLENFDENYLGRIWKDDTGRAERDMMVRRPLEGNKNMLKKRTIPFYTDGLRWRAYDAEGDFVKSFDTNAEAENVAGADGRVGEPLVPVTTNPVEMAILKSREAEKYIYGQRIFQEMKGADLARFVGFGDRALPGWTKIDDKIARVWSPSDVKINEAFDARMMDQLQSFAESIGGKTARAVKIGGGKGMSEAKTWGWASPSGHVATKFGGPESVLTHELGHELDFKYGLADEFVNDPKTKAELRNLADLRFEGQEVTPAFKSYVRKGSEKMANMVHAYVHMPDRFQEVAPNTFAKFESFLNEHPELAGLKEIKPSLVLGSNSATVNAGGMILRGEYYAPDEAATLINNHLSPGLQGNGFYDAWRGIGNAMNGLQLGLSAFHVGFTSMDAMISKAALGVKQMSRGDIMEGAGNVAQGLNPAQPFVNIYKGDKLLRAYLGDLTNPDLAPIVDAIQQAGGRVKMDDFYRNAQVNAFKQALRSKDYVGAAKSFLPTVLDRISAPIFEYLVPRQKLGVFFDMAKDWIKENPESTVAEKREGLGKLWDSVDNRMGQLVYDNVFWDRALKDGLMATVRSVGWNLGTFRELGGGVLDIKDIAKDKGFSDRTAYLVALPLIASIYGSVMHYAYTGEMPQSLKDTFYPKTGKTRPDGSEDRVSLPTYMKDVFAYGEDAHNFAAYGGDPTQTIKNKMHPLLSTMSQMLNNQDFFGAAIRNPADKAVTQIADEAAYILQQMTPFSYRNYIQQAKAKGEEPSVMGYLSSPSMIGITPAPGHIVKSDEELESGHVSQLHDALTKKFKAEIKAGADVESLIPEMVKSGMNKRDIKYIVSSSGPVPKPHRLKKFGSDEE